MNLNLVDLIPEGMTDILEIQTNSLSALLQQRKSGEYHVQNAHVDAQGNVQILEGNFVSQSANWQFDCICVDDVQHISHAPMRILASLRKLLKPAGCILFTLPNIQHWREIQNILAGDIQNNPYAHTYASFIKLLLDTGFEPTIPFFLLDPIPDQVLQALEPALASLKLDAALSSQFLSTKQYVFKAELNPFYQENTRPVFPISFIVPTNDPRVMHNNFLKSPIFFDGHCHQIIPVNAKSAAEALDIGVSHAEHDWIVYAHQDVYLPKGWDVTFCTHILEAIHKIPDTGFWGLCGADYRDGQRYATGLVADRDKLLKGNALPEVVSTLDEFLFAFRKEGFVGADADLGWHLYGADIAYRYLEQGKKTVVIQALCFHNSLGSKALPQAYFDSTEVFAKRWQDYLPITTLCAEIL